ncbi:hypothetical protein P4S68_16410 [Pseudoalteromonas sp. Hal099]
MLYFILKTDKHASIDFGIMFLATKQKHPLKKQVLYSLFNL